jgi:AcrR family transcriptional regulator
VSGDTRARVVTEAMRLFGEQGYHATSIAQIEQAAGLTPGAGGLYRHFRSKRALLEAGMEQQVQAGRELVAFLDDPAELAALPLRDQLRAVARAGLARLQEERDVNRLLLRDLAQFPDLLARVEQDDVRRVFRVLTGWLAATAGAAGDGVDWGAVAAVVIGATSHWWILGDVFGHHPDGVTQDRYVDALVDLVAALAESGQPRGSSREASTAQ